MTSSRDSEGEKSLWNFIFRVSVAWRLRIIQIM